MRQMFSGLVAAVAVMAVSAPAMACGGGGLFSSGCSPCAQAYVNPCTQQSYYGPYDQSAGVVAYERVPSPTQYYYVNQGPTYTGPGNLAPLPEYQERAVSGWSAYGRPYHYGYNGGRYASANHHYYDGAAVSGPAVYSHRWHRHHHRYMHGMQRPSMRYGYMPHRYAPRYSAAPRYHYGHPVLRRYY
jgi:hypothetical protein